mmetsp:Transcript_50353/g.113177  ORF Transcript_50353/g.113177 Transcript_50353/m.113177 type:complete len:261 (-) Transcript_50353:1-783(-)
MEHLEVVGVSRVRLCLLHIGEFAPELIVELFQESNHAPGLELVRGHCWSPCVLALLHLKGGEDAPHGRNLDSHFLEQSISLRAVVALRLECLDGARQGIDGLGVVLLRLDELSIFGIPLVGGSLLVPLQLADLTVQVGDRGAQALNSAVRLLDEGREPAGVACRSFDLKAKIRDPAVGPVRVLAHHLLLHLYGRYALGLHLLQHLHNLLYWRDGRGARDWSDEGCKGEGERGGAGSHGRHGPEGATFLGAGHELVLSLET